MATISHRRIAPARCCGTRAAQQVCFNTGSKSFVAKLDGATRVNAGETVRFSIPVGAVHLFDADTQQSIGFLREPVRPGIHA